MLIVKHNAEPDHYTSLKKAVTISAIPMPQSLSSFIISFDVPKNLLQNTSGTTDSVAGSIPIHEEAELTDCAGFADPSIQTTESGSLLSFTLITLNDLFCALHKTTALLRMGSHRFEYVNLKRRTRLKVTPARSGSKGFQISFRVPGFQQRPQTSSTPAQS
jgi:hypothetical protein